MIRLCSLGVRAFVHDGIDVNERWSAIDGKRLTDKQRATLRDFAGRLIRIHPEDAQAAEVAVGLKLNREGAFIKAEPDAPAPPEPTTPKKKKAAE